MARDVKKILEAVINDFKETHRIDIQMNLLSDWCKEFAIVKAKQNLLSTINDLTIYEIMTLKVEIDSLINGTSQKEAHGPGISTKEDTKPKYRIQSKNKAKKRSKAQKDKRQTKETETII